MYRIGNLSNFDIQRSIATFLNFLKGFFQGRKRYDWRNPIRSVTIQAINLVPQDTPRQIDMFTNVARIEKLEKLDLCIETIRQRFGKDSIKNAVLCQNLRMPPEKAELTMPTGMLS